MRNLWNHRDCFDVRGNVSVDVKHWEDHQVIGRDGQATSMQLLAAAAIWSLRAPILASMTRSNRTEPDGF
jgi:hypothetical protein